MRCLTGGNARSVNLVEKRGSHASLASTDIKTEENSVHINGVSVSSGLKLKKM